MIHCFAKHNVPQYYIAAKVTTCAILVKHSCQTKQRFLCKLKAYSSELVLAFTVKWLKNNLNVIFELTLHPRIIKVKSYFSQLNSPKNPKIPTNTIELTRLLLILMQCLSLGLTKRDCYARYSSTFLFCR